MVDVVITTQVDVPVTTTVTIEQIKADLIVVDDRNGRIGLAIRYIDTDATPSTVVARRLLVITGQTYLDLVGQNVIANKTYLFNTSKLADMIIKDVVNGVIPASDWKVIDVDFFEILNGISGG